MNTLTKNRFNEKIGFDLLKIDFPPLLTKEEEEKLLKKSDENSKRSLIENNLRLVLKIANNFKNSYTEFEDLVSIGTIGLIKAVNSYNLENSTKFSIYCGICIENEIVSFYRKHRKKLIETSMEHPIGYDKHGKGLLLQDVLTHNPRNDDISFAITKQCLSEFMQTLNEREQKIITYRLQGLTQQQISSKLNLVQSRVSTIQKKLLNNLKEYIA